MLASRDGDDGRWSSFQLRVGTPPQVVRLLPATSATAGNCIFVVLPEGCSDSSYPPDCPDIRGYTFASNKSTTWSVEKLSNGGLFELPLQEEQFLGYSGNAFYGFDNVTFGLGGSGLPALSNQLIASIITPDFWVGSLGLSPLAFNFTSLNEPIPSLLATLRNKQQIPSTSWAYTAGAHYQDPPIFGSLTLGGYDTSRFVPNDLSIAFGADQSRDLVLSLQTITYDSVGSSPLLSAGIYAFINSMVAQMWLPIEVCYAFEKAFNLVWNETAELYLMDADQHSRLVAQNPTFTFKIGSTLKGGESVDITIPYAALDLNVSAPLVNGTSHYFPLKRAQNGSQYTLGRVFLQQAYVIADYERSNFSVSQALFPSTGVPQHLVPLLPPGAAASAPVAHRGLSPGAIAGATIGAIIAVLILALVGFICFRRYRRPRIPPVELPATGSIREEESAPTSPTVITTRSTTTRSTATKSTATKSTATKSTATMSELYAPTHSIWELDGTVNSSQATSPTLPDRMEGRHELAGHHELDGRHELEDQTPK